MSAPALYVHIPFCETKCPYCDFNSFAVEGRDVDGYLDALLAEFDSRGFPRTPSTIFVGGGTPTVVDPEQIERYLLAIHERIDPDPAREFTVEANPGSLTPEKIAVLVEQGVNRVSLGAQALFDKHLAALGRVHSVDDIERAYADLRAAGIANISLDLIYAIPGMTRREWAQTLDRIVKWGVDHLSCYALIFEAGTEFFARRASGSLRSVPEGKELAMFRLTERRLRSVGLERYEISNFAQPGRRCEHNLTYWRNGSYAGFGAGAFSFLEGCRMGNVRSLHAYQESVREKGSACISRERLQGLRAARESVALGLRTAEGVDLDEIGSRHKVDLRAAFAEEIERLEAGGFVCNSDRLRLARRGWRVADTVGAAFL